EEARELAALDRRRRRRDRRLLVARPEAHGGALCRVPRPRAARPLRVAQELPPPGAARRRRSGRARVTKRIGLTLGKFAPLHRGHELLIETALGEVEHLIVLVYDCPETTPVPLGVRAQWIRDLYPSV